MVVSTLGGWRVGGIDGLVIGCDHIPWLGGWSMGWADGSDSCVVRSSDYDGVKDGEKR